MHTSTGEGQNIATFDLCNPREMTVAIPRDPDPNVVLWPSCTRVMRCGGCCPSELFDCEPMETVTTMVGVLKSKLPYPGSQRFDYLGVIFIPIEKHVRCEPKCKVKAIHCNPMQNYYEHDCRCVCKNQHLASQCPSHKVWSDDQCACVCPNRNTARCFGFQIFNEDNCACGFRVAVSGGAGGYIVGIGLIDDKDRNVTVIDQNVKQTIAPNDSALSTEGIEDTTTSTVLPTTITTTEATTTTTTPKPTSTSPKPVDPCAGLPPCPKSWSFFITGNTCRCVPNIFLPGRGKN
ncbi:hypothetical protein ACJMK2_032987 [Sinanodonta woodiana]|uniref:Platelet-derived growth factor (PDGF) family profile domain-containing protein n=1 Tax=Sinanodonta woodiana TaxID=1069815 RepID=A0ABD3X3E8_SINWO